MNTSPQVPNWTKKKPTRTWRTWKSFLLGNNKPLKSKGLTYRNKNGKIIPKPSFLNKTQKGSAIPEYLLRAASMVNERSPETIETNLKLLKSRKNKRTLSKLLRKTRRNRKTN